MPTIPSIVSELHSNDLRQALCTHSVVLVSVPGPCRSLSKLLSASLSATSCHVLPDISTSRPSPHTDLPHHHSPPRFTGFLTPSDCPSFRVSLANVQKIVTSFSAFDTNPLRGYPVQISDTLQAPLLFNSYRARVQRNLDPATVQTNLPKQKHYEYVSILSAFLSSAQAECAHPYNTIAVPASTLIIFDNHRHLHTLGMPLTSISQCQVQHVSFDLPNPPQLERSLFAAANHPLFASPSNPLDFSQWPIVTKPQLLKRLRQAPHVMGKPHLYWGPSGGTTAKRIPDTTGINQHQTNHDFTPPPFLFETSLPADVREVKEQRTMLAHLYVDSGAVCRNGVVFNLMRGGFGGRSMEVQSHVLTELEVTAFPLGPFLSDDDLYEAGKYFKVTTIIGMTSRLLRFAVYCERKGLKLESLRSVIYGGEQHRQESLKCLSKIGHNVKCVGVFGSSEVGVFAVKEGWEKGYRTWDDGMVVEVVDDEGKKVSDGTEGRLVITNVMRYQVPMVRFCQEDRGHMLKGRDTEFEFAARDWSNVYWTFGAQKVSWNEVEKAVGEHLCSRFGGCFLFQLWIKREGAEFDVDVAVFAPTLKPGEKDWMNAKILNSLQQVIKQDSCVVRHLGVKWLSDGDELNVMLSSKIVTFVDLTARSQVDKLK